MGWLIVHFLRGVLSTALKSLIFFSSPDQDSRSRLRTEEANPTRGSANPSQLSGHEPMVSFQPHLAVSRNEVAHCFIKPKVTLSTR